MSVLKALNGALFVRRVGIYRIALGLVGLLGIAAALISLGSKSTEAEPSMTSFAPSGAAAFAELLRRSGHNVVASNSTVPNLLPGDLAIAFVIDGRSGDNFLGADVQQSERTVARATKSAVADFVSRGGNLLLLHVPENFQSATGEMQEATVVDLPGFPSSSTVSLRSTASVAPIDISKKPGETLEIGTLDKARTLALLAKVGQGYVLEPVDGTPATNRYIDHSNNAALMLRFVSLVAKPGDRIVFPEGTWGNASPPSLMESIGPWALGAWRQLIALGFVMVWTLGRRFGLGRETRSKEQGSRDLVDAIAFIYERAKATRPALRTAVARTEATLRKRLKLGNEATSKDINDQIPDRLARALADTRKLSLFETDPLDAFESARLLDQELEAFLEA